MRCKGAFLDTIAAKLATSGYWKRKVMMETCLSE